MLKLPFKKVWKLSDDELRAFSNKEKRSISGHLGELIVQEYFNINGYNAVLSEDDYDMEKDITLNGKEKVQVKTRYPHYQRNLCSTKIEDWKFIQHVDRLIHLLPPEEDNLNFKLIEVIDKTKFKIYDTKQGRKMMGWCLSTNCKVLKTFKNPRLSQIFRILSVSDYDIVKKEYA